MTIPALIRRARAGSGLSQAELARRTGVAQPAISAYEHGATDPRAGTLVRLLAGARSSLVAVPTVRPSVSDVADAIGSMLAAGEVEDAWRGVLIVNDALSAETPFNRLLLSAAPPDLTGSTAHDAALAGLVEHYLSVEGLPHPPWVDEPSRTITEPWFASPSEDAVVRSEDQEQTPPALLRHGIVWPAAGLESL